MRVWQAQGRGAGGAQEGAALQSGIAGSHGSASSAQTWAVEGHLVVQQARVSTDSQRRERWSHLCWEHQFLPHCSSVELAEHAPCFCGTPTGHAAIRLSQHLMRPSFCLPSFLSLSHGAIVERT